MRSPAHPKDGCEQACEVQDGDQHEQDYRPTELLGASLHPGAVAAAPTHGVPPGARAGLAVLDWSPSGGSIRSNRRPTTPVRTPMQPRSGDWLSRPTRRHRSGSCSIAGVAGSTNSPCRPSTSRRLAAGHLQCCRSCSWQPCGNCEGVDGVFEGFLVLGNWAAKQRHLRPRGTSRLLQKRP